MSKIADALKKASERRSDAISPMRERDKFSTNHKMGGKMNKSWMTWIFIVAVVAVFAVFNYQEGKDAVPLSEIFPDEEILPVGVAYEFVDAEVAPAPAALPPAKKEIASAPVEKTAVSSVSAGTAQAVNEANYTVQIASFKDKKLAEQALVGIKAKIPSAYIASRDLGEKGIWHRIYAGQFQQRSEAEVTLRDIKQNYDGSFIISPKSFK